MGESLVDWVDAQLKESDLAEDAALLVLAALDGDQELDAYLADGTAAERATGSPDDADVEALGVFLRSIKVEGFRGIGSSCELKVSPTPGITVVAGRNGSGKSSFSEALELVLTGDTYRWVNKSAAWREQWRNLHHPSARLAISLEQDGVGSITVTSTWADTEKSVAARTVTCQVDGKPKVDGIGHLGWTTALEQFRPILSYDELGGTLDGPPSELYDALASILGVEQLGDAVKRLKVRSDARKGPGKAAADVRKALRDDAGASTDPRAVEAAGLLKKTDPDTGQLRALATGGDPVDPGPIGELRALAGLSVPALSDAADAVGKLRTARNDLADAGAEVSQRNRDRLKLLEQGLRLHAEHGDQTCPVCAGGYLDAGWATTAQGLAEREKHQFAKVDEAEQSFGLAFERVRQLLQKPPLPLTTAPVDALQPKLDAVRTAWTTWTTCDASKSAAGADVLATHVETHLPPLAAAVAELHDSANGAIAALDDEWQPLASRIAGWCDDWDDWKKVEPTVAQLQSAETWLKDNDLRLKNERLQPIEDKAREAWKKLRQESNIELGGLKLVGSSNRRKLQVSGEIDGEAVDSFAVFSQGELHALTLSLFLPRATLAQSPFRFVVLDDPVQAMDPAKVDGLVELLADLAKTRQVIVFSHDDRLPAALRRSTHDAKILEVRRAANSVVSVADLQDPAKRYLDDAHGLIMEWRNERLNEDALRRTLPGMLRFAIEAAAKDRYFVQQLKAGASVHDLDDTWSDAHTTRERVLLAVFGSPSNSRVAQEWIKRPYRNVALGIAGSGFHKGLTTDPEDAHQQTKKLVDDIRNGAK